MNDGAKRRGVGKRRWWKKSESREERRDEAEVRDLIQRKQSPGEDSARLNGTGAEEPTARMEERLDEA